MMRSSRVDDAMGIELGMRDNRTLKVYHDEKQNQDKSTYHGQKLGGLLGSRDGSAIPAQSKVLVEDKKPWWKQILDPGSEIVLKWNRIFLVSCLVSLFIDPLYFFLWEVENGKNNICMKLDTKLSITVTFFRSVADLFYILYIILKFRTAYVAPSTRVFRGELVTDPKMIVHKYLRFAFFIDLAAALPLPQIVLWSVIWSSRADHDNNSLPLIVFIQYIPRLYRIFPLSYEIIKSSGVVLNTAWAGAVYNLLLYLIASHVFGSLWYLLSVGRQMTCWKSQCRLENVTTATALICDSQFFNCDTLSQPNRQSWADNTKVFTSCNASDDNTLSFNFGIFKAALSNGAPSTRFIKKYFYCLWWGLQTLSSYAQSLNTSLYLGETLFCILIVILGLILFAQLIGNMETYLKSISIKLEEYRLRKRDTEEWMRHRRLPKDLHERVKRFVQYKWLVTRGVDEESILLGLPADLRRDIKRHLCSGLVRRVPFFSQIDDQLLDAICDRLVSSLSIEGAYIVREGDPVNEMLFIVRGKLESTTTNGGQTGFFNSIILRPGEFCGEELLSWALVPQSKGNLPSSTRTIKALVEVEAFALRAEDLKFVAIQFRRLHSKKLQHTFHYYSHHWRAWAACFIQAAWRRSKKRKMARDSSIMESFSSRTDEQEEVYELEHEDGDTSTSLTSSQPTQSANVTLLARKFAANTRKGAQKLKAVDMPRLQKPDEPDFSTSSQDID